MSFHSRHLILCSLLALLATLSGSVIGRAAPSPAFFATGGPDSYGYRFADSQEATGPNFSTEYENIGTTGTQISFNSVDDGFGTVSIPAGYNFRFYGTNYTTFNVITNGNIQFNSQTTTFGNAALPTTVISGGLIAPYWDDLYQTGAANCRWQLLGSGPTARLVVQWSNYYFYPGSSGNLNFQVKMYLNETSNPSPGDGQIIINYAAMNGANGSSATIGIQRPAQASYLTYTLNGSPNQIADNRSIRFGNNVPPNPPTGLLQTGETGGSARGAGFVTDSTIFFRAAGSDPDASNTVGIEVEILPATTSFQAATTGTVVVTPTNALVPNGEVAQAALDFSTTSLPSGSYHWRARTKDNAGATSAWVEFNPAIVHFVTDFVPPTPPSGPFSPNGVQLILEAPTGPIPFTWGAAFDSGPVGPIDYRLELSNTDTFATIIFETTTTNTTTEPTLMASDTPYFWRVTAIDQAGNVGQPSATSVYQQAWTQANTGPGDRHATCGAGFGGATSYSLALAAVAALMGLLRAKRRS